MRNLPALSSWSTREQRPFEFGSPIRTDYFSCATTLVTTLREGDYSVALPNGSGGPPAPLSIRPERKSLGDLYSYIGCQRERFEHELARLTQYRYRGLIVEASLDELAHGYPRRRVHPHAKLGSLCAWAVRYALVVWLAGDHQAAAVTAQRLLENFAIETLHREHHSPRWN